ncbi:MAG: hypothetical protein C0478_17325 [Planctomyces sp.]|nr:hypothetical protein [Planctomyces sp.]
MAFISGLRERWAAPEASGLDQDSNASVPFLSYRSIKVALNFLGGPILSMLTIACLKPFGFGLPPQGRQISSVDLIHRVGMSELWADWRRVFP